MRDAGAQLRLKINAVLRRFVPSMCEGESQLLSENQYEFVFILLLALNLLGFLTYRYFCRYFLWRFPERR